MMKTERAILAVAITGLAFLWRLQVDLASIKERLARIEGGLRAVFKEEA